LGEPFAYDGIPSEIPVCPAVPWHALHASDPCFQSGAPRAPLSKGGVVRYPGEWQKMFEHVPVVVPLSPTVAVPPYDPDATSASVVSNVTFDCRFRCADRLAIVSPSFVVW
jgi:hypothetical protein